MGIIFAYSVTVSLILILAYGGYRLSGNCSPKLRRIMLLGIYGLALVVIPVMLSFDFSTTPSGISTITADTLPKASITTTAPAMDIFDILLRIYLVGICLCTFLTIAQFTLIYNILRQSLEHKISGHTVYVHNRRDISPFCFGGVMFANAADVENHAIMIHESTHISRRHTVDILIAQFTAILCWYCPAAWLLRRELKLVHEFQADEAVIRNGVDTKLYCRLIVERAAGLQISAIANSFNHKNLKKRIKMMQTTQSERRRSRPRAIFPLVAIFCAVLLLSVPSVSNAIGRISQAALQERGLDMKGQGATFVIYGANLHSDVVKKGNFKQVTDFENENITAQDVDGVIFPNIGAVFCTDKQVLQRLAPGIRKYMVDGYMISEKEFSKIPAAKLCKVILTGNSMQVYTRDQIESTYFNALETAINAENKF